MRIPVPTVQTTVEPGVSRRVPMAQGGPLGGVRDLAAGLADVSNALSRNEAIRADNFERAQHEQRKARVMERASADRLKWTEALQKRQTEADPAADDFTPKLATDFDGYRETALGGIEDEDERRMYGETLTRLRENLLEHGIAFQGNQRRTYRKQVLAEGVDTDARTLTVDPSQFRDVLALRLAAINSSTDLPATEKTQIAQQARETIAWSAAQTLMMRDPSGMVRRLTSDINADPVLGSLPPERISQLQRAAQTEVERGVSSERTRLAAQERDIQSMVMAGVAPPTAPTMEEYIRVYGPDGARRYESEVAAYVRVGDGIQAMRNASPEQRAAVLAAAEPKPGEGFAEQAKIHGAMQHASVAIQKRLTDDPALYAVENSPRVAQAQRAMAKIMENPDAALPTGERSAPDAARAGVVDFYARTMAAEQQRLGVAQPKLLTDNQARGIVQQFYDQRSGGKNAAQLVAGLEQTWGRWWSQVYSQLASDAKLPPAALVIPNMKDAGARQRLAEWSAMKPDERKALLQSSDAKDIRDGVLSQFSGAASSFMAQGGAGQRTVSTIIDQAEILAAGYRSQGKSVGDASKQAFEEVLGWKYDFADTYRVPKDQQVDAVQAGARAALQALDDVQPLASGLDAANAKAQTLDAVRANPVWVTNRDESGLRLMVKGQDGGLYQVARGNGQPLEYTWGALRAMALDARTASALRGNRLPTPPAAGR